VTQPTTGFQHYTTPPTFRVELAERPSLLELLRSTGHRRLVLLDAPAGYGKTWLLTRWYAELRKTGSRVVWLGADEMETPELLALVVAGFQRSGLDVGRLEGLAAQGFADVPVRAVVASLTAALEAAPSPVVIILDDLHRLARDAVQDVLARLVLEAPPAVPSSSRRARPVRAPDADLRTRGDLLEIGAEQLRFGRDEGAPCCRTFRSRSSTSSWCARKAGRSRCSSRGSGCRRNRSGRPCSTVSPAARPRSRNT
jgi:ATP/maltotriose-dependent transcriptional regulator MalT